jgi:hypothetical protein
MNEKFEQDQAIETLRKSAKAVRAPKLDESILETASLSEAKPSLMAKLNLSRRATGFSLAGVAASLAGVAVIAGSVLNPQPTFTLEMGANAPQGSNKSVMGESSDSKVGGLSYWPGAPLEIDYVAGDALSGEAGSGSIYEFVNNTTAKELSASIKRVLKIDGAFVTETYGVETPNGEEKVTYFNLQSGAINVYVTDTNGALNFNYSNQEAWVLGECTKEETSPEMPEMTYCVENAPVKADLPTDKQAIASALELFSGLGFETTAADITVNRSEDSLYAFAPIKVDGKSTGLSWDIAWGNTGKISSLNGYAVDAVKVADVSTISAKDTVKRMNDYRWTASGSAELYQTASTISSRMGDDTAANEGKTQQILVVKATEALGIIYDANGKMYAVPSYAMFTENDSYPLVIVSVVDGVIKLPEPIVWPQDGMIEPEVKTGLTD